MSYGEEIVVAQNKKSIAAIGIILLHSLSFSQKFIKFENRMAYALCPLTLKQ